MTSLIRWDYGVRWSLLQYYPMYWAAEERSASISVDGKRLGGGIVQMLSTGFHIKTGRWKADIYTPGRNLCVVFWSGR